MIAGQPRCMASMICSSHWQRFTSILVFETQNDGGGDEDEKNNNRNKNRIKPYSDTKMSHLLIIVRKGNEDTHSSRLKVIISCFCRVFSRQHLMMTLIVCASLSPSSAVENEGWSFQNGNGSLSISMRLPSKNTQKMTHWDRYHACALSFDDMDALCSSRAEEKKKHINECLTRIIFITAVGHMHRERAREKHLVENGEREKQLWNDREQG